MCISHTNNDGVRTFPWSSTIKGAYLVQKHAKQVNQGLLNYVFLATPFKWLVLSTGHAMQHVVIWKKCVFHQLSESFASSFEDEILTSTPNHRIA